MRAYGVRVFVPRSITVADAAASSLRNSSSSSSVTAHDVARIAVAHQTEHHRAYGDWPLRVACTTLDYGSAAAAAAQRRNMSSDLS
jgi:hypothetical protein